MKWGAQESGGTMTTGLNHDETEFLSDFTKRLAEATAALRDAWLRADPENAHAIEVAIAVLFQESHSMQRNTTTMRKVLAFGHERQEELITNVSCALMDIGAMSARLQHIMMSARELKQDMRGFGGVLQILAEAEPILTLQQIEADAEACLTIFHETSAPTVAPVAPSETRMKP